MNRRTISLAVASLVAAAAVIATPFAFADDDTDDSGSAAPARTSLFPTIDSPAPNILPAVPAVPSSPSGLLPNSLDIDPDPGEPDASSEGSASLSPVGGSGITAKLKIDGTSVTGTAKGLDPDKRYISLYYGSQSKAAAGSTFTCADLRTAAFTQSWGLTPAWKVNADGTGTLNATAPRTISQGVRTVSIREVPAVAGDTSYTLFDPVRYPVRACGAVIPSK